MTKNDIHINSQEMSAKIDLVLDLVESIEFYDCYEWPPMPENEAVRKALVRLAESRSVSRLLRRAHDTKRLEDRNV